MAKPPDGCKVCLIFGHRCAAVTPHALDPATALLTGTTIGALTMLYYDGEGLLFAMDRGGSMYYIGTDQAGTPHVVEDSTGTAVKLLEYDSFGKRLSDSNPGFDLPIGFAGGLEDTATGLVRFGYRDFEQASGRWTARDPVLYDGGQANLYVYVGNDPVGLRDPLRSGVSVAPFTICLAAGPSCVVRTVTAPSAASLVLVVAQHFLLEPVVRKIQAPIYWAK